jgi:hypothetical protein
MSVLMRYRADPPSSVLFQRLLNDKALVTLMLAFYNYGFSFFDVGRVVEDTTVSRSNP